VSERFLAEPRSLIDCYLYACGDSEVPPQYHLWSFISLLAASVADRVWTVKFGRLLPNLYVALLGPSANGKDTAIDAMMDLASQHPKLGAINFRSTAPALIQYMSRQRQSENGVTYGNSRLHIVMPEISMSLRKGDVADDFVKVMTALYGGKPYALTDMTIGRGSQTLRDYTLNWIFGSVLEWLLDVIPHTAISGGTFGRIVGVHYGYDHTKRFYVPTWPGDRDEVIDHIHKRLDDLAELEGPFIVTRRADMQLRQWYDERQVPDDESLIPAWKRQHDLILKLSMLLSLSDGLDLTIRDTHVHKAQQLSEAVIRRLADIQAAASTSRDTQGIVFVRQVMKSMKRPMMRTELMKRLINKGIGGATALDEIMNSLVGGGEVEQMRVGRGAVYEYKGRRKMPKSSGNGAGPDETPTEEN